MSTKGSPYIFSIFCNKWILSSQVILFNCKIIAMSWRQMNYLAKFSQSGQFFLNKGITLNGTLFVKFWVFSRRFMKWNATIIVTFYSRKKTKKRKFYEILWSQIESFGLANWTKKVFSLFPRNIQYRERLKGPPFSFFGFVRLFSQTNHQRLPLQFFDVLQQLDAPIRFNFRVFRVL